MIDLYNWHTSNGRKLFIMLEELGAEYNTHAINIGKDDQFTPEFVAINPNSKIPAMIDQDGPGGEPFTLFESGAMLMYLADKYGRFIPPVSCRPLAAVVCAQLCLPGPAQPLCVGDRNAALCTRDGRLPLHRCRHAAGVQRRAARVQDDSDGRIHFPHGDDRDGRPRVCALPTQVT